MRINRECLPVRRRTVRTSHGLLAVQERGTHGPPVLFIHGNSSCAVVFEGLLQSSLAVDHRLVTLDLPGHGQSSDAPDPHRTYTRPGLAQAVCEALTQLDLEEAVVVGWSLGGHVGIEMLAHVRGLRGLMVVGAPPIAANAWARGFIQSPHAWLAAQQNWSPADVEVFLSNIYGHMPEPRLRQAAVRADGRLRQRLFEAAREGAGVDQRHTVETSQVPLAVVNGAADPLINLDYFDTLAYANLWDGRCHRLPGLGHAPFWEAPEVFTPLLARFLGDVG